MQARRRHGQNAAIRWPVTAARHGPRNRNRAVRVDEPVSEDVIATGLAPIVRDAFGGGVGVGSCNQSINFAKSPLPFSRPASDAGSLRNTRRTA